ncbi:hypothetical protein G7068_12105 [Leucobacter viscericola]|uniref:Uncharacterized protein n=1 Tax=Leucobacter viscericola TaxID=2714935 RepID=A0A6G7XDA4_9MICO|nr:hypothetical protein [Leucobacter viscericola]QIK62358.1 hypothetical protein G7068_03385 [Leucobacter viscericola]QIK63852.1 hypothetical protein G7068_12105 [Leucobacter viscericola]
MESLVATKQQTLIQVDPATGLLLYKASPYELTLDEMHQAFVVNAPFPEDRSLLFEAFVVYLKQTRSIVPDRRVWVDGSFVSLRQDRPPNDLDLVLIINQPTRLQRQELAGRGLLTMSEASFKIDGVDIPVRQKLAPYGGMLDAYQADASKQNDVARWEVQWSTPKDDDGHLDFSREKGFVEVDERG